VEKIHKTDHVQDNLVSVYNMLYSCNITHGPMYMCTVNELIAGTDDANL